MLQTLIIQDVTSHSFKSRFISKINIFDLGRGFIAAAYRRSAPCAKGKGKVMFTLEQTTKAQGDLEV